MHTDGLRVGEWLRKIRGDRTLPDLARAAKAAKGRSVFSKQLLSYYEKQPGAIPESKLELVEIAYSLTSEQKQEFRERWILDKYHADTSDAPQFADLFWAEVARRGDFPGSVYVLTGLPLQHGSPEILRRIADFLLSPTSQNEKDASRENRIVLIYEDREEDVGNFYNRFPSKADNVLSFWPRLSERLIREYLDAISEHIPAKDRCDCVKRIVFKKLSRTSLLLAGENDREATSPLSAWHLLSANVFSPFLMHNLYVGHKQDPVSFLYVQTELNTFRWLKCSKENARRLTRYVALLLESGLLTDETIEPTLPLSIAQGAENELDD